MSYRIIFIILVAAMIVSSAGAQVVITDPAERSTLHVVRAPANMKIDGDITPREWKDAEIGMMTMDVFKPTRQIPQATMVRTMWDDKYLYISFECFDKDIRGTMTGCDDVICWENAVEIFIDPEGQNRHYYELEFGAAGGMTDLMVPASWMMSGSKNRSYNIHGLLHGVKVYGTINNSKDEDEKWTVEVAIPWKDFEGRHVNVPPHDGDSWRINFFRIDHSNVKGVDDYYLAWSKSIGAFHEPRNFGVITFSTQKKIGGKLGG